jgi:hypothetical protein
VADEALQRLDAQGEFAQGQRSLVPQSPITSPRSRSRVGLRGDLANGTTIQGACTARNGYRF